MQSCSSVQLPEPRFYEYPASVLDFTIMRTKTAVLMLVTEYITCIYRFENFTGGLFSFNPMGGSHTPQEAAMNWAPPHSKKWGRGT